MFKLKTGGRTLVIGDHQDEIPEMNEVNRAVVQNCTQLHVRLLDVLREHEAVGMPSVAIVTIVEILAVQAMRANGESLGNVKKFVAAVYRDQEAASP